MVMDLLYLEQSRSESVGDRLGRSGIQRRAVPTLPILRKCRTMRIDPLRDLVAALVDGAVREGQEHQAAVPPAGTRLADTSNWRNKLRLTDPIVAKAAEVTALAAAKGVAPTAFATAWVMHQPGVTSPIIGPRTLEQLDAYLACLNVEITAQDSAAIDRIVAPGEHISPFYQTEFGGANRHR
jgi:diketogulonate reductase-like aldo/keto reductase